MANGDLGGTTGTKFDPLLVEDALDLIALQDLGSIFPDRNHYEEPFFVLQVADIDMSGHGWSSPMFGFMYYNGKMRKISNLTLDNVSFFGYATYDICGVDFENIHTKNDGKILYDGTAFDFVPNIKNIQVTGVSETGNSPLGNYFGNFIFDNVHVIANVDSNNSFGGGFANMLDSCHIINCSSKVMLSNYSSIPLSGGFATIINGGLIENCESTVVGAMAGSGFVAQLGESMTGTMQYPRIIECSSTATIVGSAYGFSAGFAGLSPTLTKAEIINCYCDGTIADGIQMTGFVGMRIDIYDPESSCMQYSNINIENCYSLIESITRDNFNGPNQIYRFSPCPQISDANYISSSMQFIDEFIPPEGMPPELWQVPFDDGIEVSGATMPEHEYPIGVCPSPPPVHKMKTFYLN